MTTTQTSGTNVAQDSSAVSAKDAQELIAIAEQLREVKHWAARAAAPILAEIAGRMLATPATAELVDGDAVQQNLALVIERLDQIKHIAEGHDKRGLAIEALVCARALAAQLADASWSRCAAIDADRAPRFLSDLVQGAQHSDDLRLRVASRDQQPAGALGVKAWVERAKEAGAGYGNYPFYMQAEIDELRAQLARQSQGEPVAWGVFVPGAEKPHLYHAEEVAKLLAEHNGWRAEPLGVITSQGDAVRDSERLDRLDQWRATEAKRGFQWSSIHFDMDKPVREQLDAALAKAEVAALRATQQEGKD